MRRTTAAASASAALLCLSVLLSGCGGTSEHGYVAVGAAGPSDGRAPTKAVPPEGEVELTPLDGDRPGDADGADERAPGSSAPGSSAPGSSASPAAPGPPGDSAPAANSPSPPGTPRPPGSSDDSGSSGDGSPGSGSPTPRPPSPALPAGPDTPAGLVIGRPALVDTDVRWCEKVTVDFLHTGKRPVTAGTITFGTHVIGPLGIDWATIDSTRRLPLPLAPGERKTGTWRVCVDAWRVPLGMHIDTRDVTFDWK
ncbi:hypothetical protein [Streptomyces halobius]|uniref:Secreted protein n=1 Tax=Streptomyces halobius TaxID=2879846 RepID=A0ABY4M8V4_9ACTN|nr:hypothetical protein [Streptomyces halobius]UQA94167.1 hypothetical protein K9S39_21895 [Streptomyces halobius]